MQWFKKHLWLVLALLVACWAGRELLTSSHFYTHDDIQVFRLNEFTECIGRGEIPCRWSDSMGKGYGYPLFNFYPPMIYVLSGLIHSLGFSLITSLNLLMFATFLVAGWGMYGLVQALTKRADLAFLGSILYTLYPFHATNVFIRGVYAENLAWSITPLIFWAIHSLLTKGKTRWLPYLFAFVFLTHLISSYLVAGLSLVWTLALTHLGTQSLWLNLRKLLLSLLLGIGMASFFVVPAMVEKELVQAETLTQGYYSYHNHFVSFAQLFTDYTWVYGASYFGTPPEEMGFMVGHVHIISLTILLALGSYFGLKHKRFYLAVFLTILTLATLLLSHQKSSFIYTLIPPLAYLQFPWRVVAWAALPLTLSLSLLLALLPKKLSKILILIIFASLLLYSQPFFKPRQLDTYQDQDFVSGELTANQQVSSIYDYLPKTVSIIPELYAKDSDFDIPIFYFPGWYAHLDQEPVEITASTPYGLITPVDPHIDPHSLTLTWRETPFRKAMNLVSLLTFIGYGVYLRKSHVQ